jgi:hypothetical protein
MSVKFPGRTGLRFTREVGFCPYRIQGTQTLKQVVYLVIVRPAMNPKLIHQIVGLRLGVGFLGEQEQSAWWPSSFLGRHAQAFLNPIFGSKTRMAQYNGVTEAACRVHG